MDLNRIWGEVRQVVQTWNAHRSALSSLLSFWHTNSADAIPQSTTIERFEKATELGEPESLRPPSEYLLLGYTFDDYDRASRWSWRAIREMTAQQVRATMDYALESDNRLVNGTILQRLFDPAQDANENATPVYGLYTGNDGHRPPSYLGKSFAANHSHYLVSGAAEVDSGDIEQLIKTVSEHGFGSEPGSQLILLVNPEQLDRIASFRAGIENATGIFANHDFVPSQGAPAFYTPNEIVGERAPAKFEGLRVAGSFGAAWVIALDDVPEGYMACVATYGNNSPGNCIGVRQHINPNYQGFRVIPGPVPAYPITSAFYTRAFGVGVRRRGQAAVMQIKASGSFDTPDIYSS
ncbi:hypothetical protein [Mycobacterium sp. DL]|uniref:Bacteriophage protein n=1 Tax=Mycolicibacterium hippocampi TaxID=659824 RepID=A0A850PVI7_9MYCO|nr:hypothetical protein [Mycolicibacterium hippocampi]